MGEILDIPFPSVPASANEQEVELIADQYTKLILEKTPSAVLCQGEFSLSYLVVTKLKEKGIKVISACSERNTKEIHIDGIVKKEVVFKFERFREYGKI